MTQSSRLAAHRDRMSANANSDPDVDDEDAPEDLTPEGGKPKKESTMTEEEIKAANAAAKLEGSAEGFTAANTRFTTVLASEHYAGRADLAATLLANEKLTADEIVAALAKAPAGTAPAAEENEEAGQTAAERAAAEEAKRLLAQDKPSGVEANGGGQGGKTGADDPKAKQALWDNAIAAVFPKTKQTA